jgi:hypothetical protein
MLDFQLLITLFYQSILYFMLTLDSQTPSID